MYGKEYANGLHVGTAALHQIAGVCRIVESGFHMVQAAVERLAQLLGNSLRCNSGPASTQVQKSSCDSGDYKRECRARPQIASDSCFCAVNKICKQRHAGADITRLHYIYGVTPYHRGAKQEQSGECHRANRAGVT